MHATTDNVSAVLFWAGPRAYQISQSQPAASAVSVRQSSRSPSACPAGGVDHRCELGRLDDRAASPGRHAGEVRVCGDRCKSLLMSSQNWTEQSECLSSFLEGLLIVFAWRGQATGSRSGAVCGLRSGAAARKDAELVPLWVGKYDPALIALADVGVPGT
jgi:hypothetical protein